MSVYTCTTFMGFWPVGVAGVVKADSPQEAADLLNQKLNDIGLPGDAKEEDMKNFSEADEQVRVLCDGNY